MSIPDLTNLSIPRSYVIERNTISYCRQLRKNLPFLHFPQRYAQMLLFLGQPIDVILEKVGALFIQTRNLMVSSIAKSISFLWLVSFG